jgi:8-oxo-dGTP pyrophosphatase MutT (NUDIX family)
MGAGIMLVCGDKVLIIKRSKYKHDRFSEYWNFPGGKGDREESHYNTAIRETYEETSIDSSQYQIVNHIATRYYTMYIAIIDREVVPILDHEHTDWKWVSIDTIPLISNQLHPKDWVSYKKYYKIY